MDENNRFHEATQHDLRARERDMLMQLQDLSLKRNKIQFLKKQHDTLQERIKLEIKKHNWNEQSAMTERAEIEKALKEIQRAKTLALE